MMGRMEARGLSSLLLVAATHSHAQSRTVHIGRTTAPPRTTSSLPSSPSSLSPSLSSSLPTSPLLLPTTTTAPHTPHRNLYRSQLTNITTRLVATGAKLLYVSTTPFMPKRTLGDTVVEDMNAIAAEVVAPHKVRRRREPSRGGGGG